MKTISYRIVTLVLACGGSSFLATTAHATGQARADFRNISSAQLATQQQNPGVAFFGGYLKGTQTQTANAVILQECSFGQAFSQWYPSDTYARDILGANGVSGVRGALYPATSSTSDLRNQIANSGKPFRYKWLMYQGNGTDVTAFDATTLANWFTPADRLIVAAQIDVLKKAVAASPLDTSLRNTLLDVYYDLAVAEMQATKPLLAKLAKFRLGLEVLPPDKFIIDQEIDTYVEITDAMLAAINQYTSLLTDPFPDIDPSSVDPIVPLGTITMGRYIFLREQVRRSSVPSQYANQSGILEVPQPDGNGQPVTPGTLFNGYKDLNTMLQIVGQRQQHLASLARLRGTRKAPGDLALARESLAQVAGADITQLQVIKSWFPELFPPDLNALSQAERLLVEGRLQQSGVLASLSTIELGRIDLASVTPLLNGNVNALGYDPDFLLLVQDTSTPSNPKESYDTLRDMLKGPNQPLTVALAKLTAATSAYNNFQEKVDQVAGDIDDADESLADRFFAITGFEPDASPGFDLLAPNPNAGSELDGVLATIAALDAQVDGRKALTAELDDQLADGADGAKAGAAVAAVGHALEREEALLQAGEKYKEKTRPLYDELISSKVWQVGAQATYDTVSDVASIYAGGLGLDPLKDVSATGAAITVGVVGAINVGIQTIQESDIGRAEQEIDYAGIDFSIATETVDAAMLVNQARQQLSTLKREQVANNLAANSDQAARLQAEAQKSALMAELTRIVTKRNANVAAIRKKSYTDPLHYYRAENALIAADESFRAAQVWLFYTLQALNYKWHGQFAITPQGGNKTYDTSTVFKCRNADELDDLLSAMVLWDAPRVVQTTSSPRIFTRISLRDHILARNPNRYDPVDPADPGTRGDDTIVPRPTTLPTLPTLQYFRKVLTARYLKDAGTINARLEIPFGTTFRNQIVDRVDGNFFRGASYDANGIVSDPGFWREKIEYVKVNVVAANAPVNPENLSGSLTYGGTLYFHTRVPPRSNRTVGGLLPDDAPGELMAATFRYWVSPDFSANFVPVSEHTPSIPVAYSRFSGVIRNPQSGATEEIMGLNYQVNAFSGRSIAASGWKLKIPRVNNNGFIVDANNIDDIEIIIAYKHSDRVAPPPN